MAYGEAVHKLAQKYSVNPYGMIGILAVYETIQRFAGYSQLAIDNAIAEIPFHYSPAKPPKYTYEELPIDLVVMLKNITRKHGSISSFLAQKACKHNFIMGFIKKKYQPSSYLFAGSLTARGLQRGEHTDNTRQYDVVTYEE